MHLISLANWPHASWELLSSLFFRGHYLSWLTEVVFFVCRAVRAMSESMRQNRLSRGQNDGSIGPSNDSQKHVRYYLKYIDILGHFMSLSWLVWFHFSEYFHTIVILLFPAS